MSIISKKTAGFSAIAGSLIILALNMLFTQGITTSLLLLAGLLLSVFFLHNPQVGVFLIILIRPSIDKLSESVGINLAENLNFNAGALFGVLAVFLLSIFLIKNFRYLKGIPISKSWLVFLLISAVSIFFSINYSFSFYEIIRLLSVFLIFSSAYVIVVKKKNVKDILYAIIFSSLLPFLFATCQLISGTGLGGTSGIESRLLGTFSHPNPFASFVVILLVSAIYLFLTETQKTKKYALTFMILWGIVLLIETYSRGAWLAFFLFIFIISAIKSPKSLLALGAISLFLFVFSQTIQERVQDVYNPPADSSVRWRFEQWNRMYAIFLKSPLTGQGIGTEIVAHENEYGYNAGNQYTHNDFLRVALETGVFGVIAYLILIILTLKKIIQIYFKAKPGNIKDFNLFILALFLAMVSFSLTNNTLRETATQWLLWSLVAASFAYSQEPKKELERE